MTSVLSVSLWLMTAAVPVRDAAAQDEGRSFTVTAAPARATVGDTVRLRFRLVVNERDLLTDTVPRPVGELPEGVRVLSVERLRRGADRAFTGGALVAFYRPGEREVPRFGVPWLQIVTGRRSTVTTGPATVEIVPLLPAGNPALRDIRALEPAPGPGPLPLFLAGAAAAVLLALLARRRRPATTGAPEDVPMPAPPAATDPHGAALERLLAIERKRLAERGEVDRHYEAVADTLRAYLDEAADIPARERTTTELLWALPPHLTEGGLRRLAGRVLGEADLVKFAAERPGPDAAAAYLQRARDLLQRWHRAAPAGEEADALR